jgi:hypothetical protein
MIARKMAEKTGVIGVQARLLDGFRGAMSSMTSTAGVPCRRVGLSTSVRNSGEFAA